MPTSTTEWLHNIWNVWKTVGPWLTGGLAGAVLTYFLNQRSAWRKAPRIYVQTTQVDYSLSAHDTGLKDLRVSYGSESFDNLLLFQLDAVNASSRTIDTSPFLILLPEKVRIADYISSTQPLHREVVLEAHQNQRGAYNWNPGTLKPGDSARLRLLVTPASQIRWSFRGNDDVVVISDGRSDVMSIESELRSVVAWIALFLTVGSVPLFGDAARGFLLLISLPFISRQVHRWRAFALSRRPESLTGPVVVTSNTCPVHVEISANCVKS